MSVLFKWNELLLVSVTSGTAVVMQDKALVWIDARYMVAAKEQLDSCWTPIFDCMYIRTFAITLFTILSLIILQLVFDIVTVTQDVVMFKFQ